MEFGFKCLLPYQTIPSALRKCDSFWKKKNPKKPNNNRECGNSSEEKIYITRSGNKKEAFYDNIYLHSFSNCLTLFDRTYFLYFLYMCNHLCFFLLQVAIAQVHLLKDQLSAETAARIEAQVTFSGISAHNLNYIVKIQGRRYQINILINSKRKR